MYIPHTDLDREKMLAEIGAEELADLFEDVPAEHRYPDLNLPPALTEVEIVTELERLAARNRTAKDLPTFLGAGAYHHYVPAAIDAILQRGEFMTAYTPYQPEISQGTLQAIFEYQSLVAALTGMDAANASHYDGATAVAEAVNMAYHIFRGRKTKVVVSPSVHPHYRETVRTYTWGSDIIVEGDGEGSDIFADPNALADQIDDNTGLVVVQYPDFFGRIYDFSALAEAAHSSGALIAVAVNPIALGLLKPPGEFGADIVTGEGQPLGIPLSFGGPYLGLFATRQEHVRKLAGRLVGETVDNRGQRGYVLTLTAREQHIRRMRATSNICTNQGLMTLAATVYLSLLGPQGLRQVATLCYDKAHYAAQRISEHSGLPVWSDVPFFHEFVVQCGRPVSVVNDELVKRGIIGGFDLANVYPALDEHMLVAVTEMNSRAEIDDFADQLREICHA